MSDQTTLKKTAYATIGLPSQMATKLREGLANLAETSSDTRERLMGQLEDAIDEWKSEGERFTAKVTETVRNRAESRRDSTKEQTAVARDVVKSVTTAVSKPAVPLEQIKGIGPNYATDLSNAGVVSPLAMLERCDSPEAIRRLSDQTGISIALIEGWIDDANLTRIRGIGEESMMLLNHIGIGSIDALSEQNPAELRARATEFDDDESRSIPTEETFDMWIKSAKKL